MNEQCKYVPSINRAMQGTRRSLKCSEIGIEKGTSHQQHHQFHVPISVVADDDDDGQQAFQDQQFPTTLEEDAILSAMDEHEQSPLLFGGAVAAAFDESSSTSGHSSSDDSGNYSPTTISNGSSVFTECISPLSDGLLLNGKDCSIYSTTPSSQHQLQQREWTVEESAPIFDPFDCNNTVVDDYHLEDVANVLMEDGFLKEYGNDESYLGETEEAQFVVQQQELQQQQQFNHVGSVHGLQMEYNDSNGSLPQHHQQQQQHWASPQQQQQSPINQQHSRQQGQCQGKTPILPSTSFIYTDHHPTRSNYNNIQSQPQHGHNSQPQYGHNNHRQFQAVDRNNHNNLPQHGHNQFQATAVVGGNGQQQKQQQFVNTAQFLPAATTSPPSKLLVLLKRPPPAPSSSCIQTLQQHTTLTSASSCRILA